ncbi:hypothetical protein, partial [Staphylococcus aureus]
MRQQGLLASGSLFQPCVTTAGERTISREAAIEMRLGDVIEFLARHMGPVERDVVIGFHESASISKSV